MDKISFQGRSQLLFDSKRFAENLRQTDTKTYRHITNKNSVTRKIPKSTTYTTETSADKMIVYIGNENEGILTTVSTQNPNQGIINNFENIVNDLLKKAKENLTAWVIGGNPIKNKNGYMTTGVLDEISKILCDKPNIDTSILAGTQDAYNKVAFKKLSNKALEVTIDSNFKPTEISENELLNNYDIVELNNVI